MFRFYLCQLLLEDNYNLSVQSINYYIRKIIEELKFCKITQKSVEEINLHEFKIKDGYVLMVQVTYNGDFYHCFDIFRKQ